MRFYVKKMGLPKKGEFHKAVHGNDSFRVFFWLLMKPSLTGLRDGNRRTPLHTAAVYGCKAPAVWLLFWGADPDAVDRNGQTALHLGAYYGRAEMVRLLVRKGANVEKKDYAGRTPQEVAILWNRQDIADYLRGYNSQGR